MMKDTLIAIGVSPDRADDYCVPLEAACKAFEINTPERVAAFLAQCAWESRMFSKTSEDLTYRDPQRIVKVFGTSIADGLRLANNPEALANHVYASRNGNGNEASGDGWRYRGRGPIELTGKRSYSYAGAALGRDYVTDPDLVCLPSEGSFVAAWFWHVNNINAAADRQDWDGCTRLVNGKAMEAAAERKALTLVALKVLSA